MGAHGRSTSALTGQQLKAAMLVAETGNQREAARRLKIPQRTVSSWAQTPAWSDHMRRLSQTGVEAAIETIRASTSEAAQVIAGIMRDPEEDSRVRLAAATALLDRVKEIGSHVHQHIDTGLTDAELEAELRAIADRARTDTRGG